jgi:hypothetical protein
MTAADAKDPIDYAKRVNRSWIVRHGLAERAEEWLIYLEQADAARLRQACVVAREMCRARERSEDPKPWFYAGLFATATEDEVQRFLANHRLTPAAVVSMWQSLAVQKWMAEVCPETLDLLHRLRSNLRRIYDSDAVDSEI